MAYARLQYRQASSCGRKVGSISYSTLSVLIGSPRRFELADLHTDSIDAEDYARFLLDCLKKITIVKKDGRRGWADDKAIMVCASTHCPAICQRCH